MSASIQTFNGRGGATVFANGAHATALDALPDYPVSAGKSGETALRISAGVYDCSFKTLKSLGFDWTSPRRLGLQVLGV